jgi:hypothetical protein
MAWSKITTNKNRAISPLMTTCQTKSSIDWCKSLEKKLDNQIQRNEKEAAQLRFSNPEEKEKIDTRTLMLSYMKLSTVLGRKQLEVAMKNTKQKTPEDLK